MTANQHSGGHDNGYASTLNSLNNEGFLDKVILLRGYRDVAHELKNLQLPLVEFKGIFMTQKLPLNHSRKVTGAMPAEPEKRIARSIANRSPSISDPKVRQYTNSVSHSLMNVAEQFHRMQM